MHFLNGFSLLLVSTSDCKLMAYKINQSSDAPFELMSCRTLPHIVTEITSDIDLRGKQKTRVNECNVTLLFDNGAIGEIDLTSILQQC